MKNIYEMAQEMKGKDNRILLGVTGGIASGKTAVSEILEELGAPLIDLDVIARQVVEPGTVALENIIDYFGKQVLHEDESLDRKKLSNIIFQDMEKRKKLESFTHPPIFEEFFKQVDEIAKKTPGVIIQVSIPLLIEENLQFMFDKIVVVYISQEQQMERLALRDGLNQADAANMLKSQLPIDEKVGYADFVINNENSIEETRRQVEEMWQELKKIQKADIVK